MKSITAFRERAAVLAALCFLGSSITPLRAAETASLPSLIREAKEHNPEVIAARERWRASQERVTQAKTWDNPKLSAEYWGIPEGSADPGAAPEKMYGIEQMIPFPGKLSLKGRAAASESDSMRWEYRDAERKAVSDLKTAYGRYYYLHKAVATYQQTAALMKSFAAVAESRYVVGKSVQSDVLRAQVEAEKMSTMVLTLQQEKETMRAEINLLVGRDAGEPLDDPEDIAPRSGTLTWEDLRKAALRNNPDIGMGAAAVEKGKWARKSAAAEYLPDFEIGYRRKTMDDQWAGSDLMIGMTVPLWFWKQRAGSREMDAELKAAESSRRNAELMAVARLKEAFTKLEATRRLLDLYAASVLPKAEQSLTVTRSAFSAGRMGFLELLDSARSYLELNLEYYNYVAEYQNSIAALERITGTDFGGQQ